MVMHRGFGAGGPVEPGRNEDMQDLETVASPTGWAVEVATREGRQRWPVWSMSLSASGRGLVVEDVFVPTGVTCAALSDEIERRGAAILRFVECPMVPEPADAIV